jgi:hypothetical protein
LFACTTLLSKTPSLQKQQNKTGRRQERRGARPFSYRRSKAAARAGARREVAQADGGSEIRPLAPDARGLLGGQAQGLLFVVVLGAVRWFFRGL